MAFLIEQPIEDALDTCVRVSALRELPDVPGLMADRVGKLYAEEERVSRIARTERLIHEAEDLH